jgi:hypothetical protein
MSANPRLPRLIRRPQHKPTHHRRLAEELKKPLRLRHNNRGQNPNTPSIRVKDPSTPNTADLGIPIRGITNNSGIPKETQTRGILSSVGNSHSNLASNPCPRQIAWMDRP